MGRVLDALLGDADTLDDSDFESFDHRNTTLNPESTLTIKTATIETKSNMLTVEASVRSGDIVLVTLGKLSGGLTEDEVLRFLKTAVDDVDGDIVQKSQNELIVTPRGVNISRSTLTD